MFLKVDKLSSPKKLRKHIRKQIKKSRTQNFVDMFVVIADSFGWTWWNTPINKEAVEKLIEDQVFDIAVSVNKALPDLLAEDDFIRYISSGRLITYFSDYDEDENIIEIELASTL